MQIRSAETAGFCFGVDRAVKLTYGLLEQGVRVTINSDNMTCSRTNVNKELDLMRTVFGFTEEEIEKMEEYAWEARFLKN